MFTRTRLILVLVALCLGATASPSTASQANRSVGGESAISRSFWTPARLKEAARVEPTLGGGFVRREARPSASRLRHMPVNDLDPAIGRIFFRSGRYVASCSGSVISTPSRQVVLTAAHCLKSERTWSRKMVFIPAYRNGVAPYGRYFARDLWIPTRFAKDSSLRMANFDLGAMVMQLDGKGRPVGDVTGALDYQTFPERVGRTHIIGYPGDYRDGEFARECDARTWAGDRRSFRLPGPVGMAASCDLGPGSSGGPWLSEYETDDGLETELVVDGVSSTTKGGRVLTSAYFGRELKNLLWSAENK